MNSLFDRPDRRAAFAAPGAAVSPDTSTTPASTMTREQVVDRIIRINPTATRSFLDRFKKNSLDLYLEHLAHAQQPRGPRSAPWRRPGDTPAVCIYSSER
ncbi:MAG: hypothetical protein AAGB51_00255 [Planctomycetota bacterium]